MTGTLRRTGEQRVVLSGPSVVCPDGLRRATHDCRTMRAYGALIVDSGLYDEAFGGSFPGADSGS